MNNNVIGAAEGTIDALRTTKDGGFKVTFEFGYDSVDLMQQLLKEAGNNELYYLTVVRSTGLLNISQDTADK